MIPAPSDSIFQGRKTMRIHLDLTHHCIATETKKRYNKALSAYFKHQGDPSFLEQEIECLKEALEKLDFPGLRARFPELTGHHDVSVELTCRPDGTLTLSLDGKPLIKA
jgi:hypothetical protein